MHVSHVGFFGWYGAFYGFDGVGEGITDVACSITFLCWGGKAPWDIL